MTKLTNNDATVVISTFSASYGILLDNPILISIAIISGLIGIWNAVAMLDEKGKLGRNIETYNAILKGAFVGTISSPLLTLLLIVFVDPLLASNVGISISDDKQIFLYLIYSLSGLLLGRKFGFFILDHNKKGKK